jgi:hypothetical protein
MEGEFRRATGRRWLQKVGSVNVDKALCSGAQSLRHLRIAESFVSMLAFVYIAHARSLVEVKAKYSTSTIQETEGAF